jgi:hypothetical protein
MCKCNIFPEILESTLKTFHRRFLNIINLNYLLIKSVSYLIIPDHTFCELGPTGSNFVHIKSWTMEGKGSKEVIIFTSILNNEKKNP